MITPKLSPNALAVLRARYLRRDERRRIIETPQEMFWRVAQNIAATDALYENTQVARIAKGSHRPFPDLVATDIKIKKLLKKDATVKKTAGRFYEMMARLDFLPNSPTLFNAGRSLQQLAACFVLPIQDNMHSIFETLHHTAIIHQSGGGTGFSFSNLRPRGDVVQSTSGVASGPVSFMRIYDAATEQIKQGGKRRGANMGILRCDHPDIEEFIMCKKQVGNIVNFNISIAATERFMRAVKENKTYPLINPRTKKTVKRESARRILKLAAKMAWQAADPGIIFLDRINRHNPTPYVGRIESTNPCGEQPLLPYEPCNLGSINASNMVADGKIDWEKLRRTVHDAVHFLDNTIDMNKYPLPQITHMARGNRKIGLGVMGFAQMLVQLGVPYASEKADRIAKELMRFIDDEAKKKSVELAKDRGVFPNFRRSIYETGKKEDRVRNATRTTIAPTGTISIIADCSSGIEPLFAVAFEHRILDDKKLYSMDKHFIDIAKRRGFYSKKLMDRITKLGRLDGIKEIPSDVKELFVTAPNIDSEQHIRVQAAFQKYTDNAVSKTINLPRSATPNDVEKIYLLAYDLGCKGITVYREGSHPAEVLTKGKRAKKRANVCVTC